MRLRGGSARATAHRACSWPPASRASCCRATASWATHSRSRQRPPHLLAPVAEERDAGAERGARAGLGALQVWQAVQAQGRGRGDEDVAILFMDLVGFSAWALDAGDEAAVALLRDFGGAVVDGGAAWSSGWATGHGGLHRRPRSDGGRPACVSRRRRHGGRGLPPGPARRRASVARGGSADYPGVDVNVAAHRRGGQGQRGPHLEAARERLPPPRLQAAPLQGRAPRATWPSTTVGLEAPSPLAPGFGGFDICCAASTRRRSSSAASSVIAPAAAELDLRAVSARPRGYDASHMSWGLCGSCSS